MANSLKEFRCSKCNKVCAYIAQGSKIANGTTMTCAKCLKPANTDVPDFLSKLFGVQK